MWPTKLKQLSKVASVIMLGAGFVVAVVVVWPELVVPLTVASVVGASLHQELVSWIFLPLHDVYPRYGNVGTGICFVDDCRESVYDCRGSVDDCRVSDYDDGGLWI